MATAPLSLLRKDLPARPLPVGSPVSLPVPPPSAPSSTLPQETGESLATHTLVTDSLPEGDLKVLGDSLTAAFSSLDPVSLAIVSPVLDDYRAQALPAPAPYTPPLSPLIEYVGALDASGRQSLTQGLADALSYEISAALPPLLAQSALIEGVLKGYPSLAQSLAQIAQDLAASRPVSLTQIAVDLESSLPDLARMLRGSATRQTDAYRSTGSQMMSAHAVAAQSSKGVADLGNRVQTLMTQSLAVEQAVQAYSRGPVDPVALQSAVLRQAEDAIKPKVEAYLSRLTASLKGSRHKTPLTVAAGVKTPAG